MSDEQPTRRKIEQNINLPMDGADFTDADVLFNSAVYSGGPLPKFKNTNFVGNQIQLLGPAENTLNFLRFMFQISAPEERVAMLRAWGFILPDETISKNANG